MVMGVGAEDGSIDFLLVGLWGGAKEQALFRWGQEHLPPMDEGGPSLDFHRLQTEYWLWNHRDQMQGRVMDVGQPWRRSWASDGYFTLGPDCDVEGDITRLDMADGSLDAIVCAEVLEHCEDPFAAARELCRVLAPGGRLFATSPFIWPFHGTQDYQDFWRFCHEGWRHLFTKVAPFADVKITECEWTTEGAVAYDQLRRWEGMGHRQFTRASTGYLVEAVK